MYSSKYWWYRLDVVILLLMNIFSSHSMKYHRICEWTFATVLLHHWYVLPIVEHAHSMRNIPTLITKVGKVHKKTNIKNKHLDRYYISTKCTRNTHTYTKNSWAKTGNVNNQDMKMKRKRKTTETKFDKYVYCHLVKFDKNRNAFNNVTSQGNNLIVYFFK